MGTLRFDLNALAESKDKVSRKKAQSLKKDFLKKARPALHLALHPLPALASWRTHGDGCAGLV